LSASLGWVGAPWTGQDGLVDRALIDWLASPAGREAILQAGTTLDLLGRDPQAHLLAADRDNSTVREYHELVHPGVFEMIARMAKDAERKKKPVTLFGESAADPVRVPFYLGVGYRSFSIAPVRLRGVAKVLNRYTVEECRKIAARILEAPRSLDVQKVLVNLDLE